MPTLLAIAADTHINSTLGLCRPIVTLDDGGQYKASKSQRWLWGRWLDFCETIREIGSSHKARIVTALLGDLGDIDYKGRSHQIITRNPATVQEMMFDTLAPIVDISDAVLVIRGTEAHVGKSGYLEEAFAADLTNGIPDLELGTFSWWHVRITLDGCVVDLAHHVSMGYLPWTEINAANKLAAITEWSYVNEWREKPPHLVARGDKHRWSDSGKNFRTLAVCVPGWQFKTSYVHKLGASTRRPQFGGAWFLLDRGEIVKWDRILYRPTRRKAPMI